MSFIRKLLYSHWFVGIVMLALLLGVYTSGHPLLERLQLATFDLYQQILPRSPATKNAPAKAVIIDIDERSLRDIGQWPWPRTVLADLVNKLTDYGVAVIGFDMVFAEEDRIRRGHIQRTCSAGTGWCLRRNGREYSHAQGWLWLPFPLP